jgi:hypothetical protein
MDVRPIEYAPPLPLHQRRHVRRRVIWITAILIGIPLVWYAAPRAWRHAELLYWQDKAMNYSPPADQVVFDNDPARAAELLQKSTFTQELFSPGRCAFRPVQSYERFTELATPPGRFPGAILFLHERRNSRGERRLVVFREGPARQPTSGSFVTPIGPFLSLSFAVYRPGTLFCDPVECGAQSFSFDYVISNPTGVRCYSGQSEGDDPSHFSVVYEQNGIRHIIDGWLMDDDTIKLELRR